MGVFFLICVYEFVFGNLCWRFGLEFWLGKLVLKLSWVWKLGLEFGFDSSVLKLGLEAGVGSWVWSWFVVLIVFCWFGGVFSFGGHVFSVCGLCWFVIFNCSLIIGGIACLAVRLMPFSVVLFCYLVWVLM